MSDNRRIDFDAIKARADLRAVLAHYRLPQGRGTQFKIRCPFHDDEEPSLSVNVERGVFHCFGAGCGAEGNVLDLVHRLEARGGAAVTIRQAALTLAEICGIPLSEVEAPRRRREARQKGGKPRTAETLSRGGKGAPEAPQGPSAAAPAAAEPAANRPLGFELTLAPGHPYLKERGVSPELARLFGLGYFAGARGLMVGRLCIPIHNADGALVAYAGRWVGVDGTIPEGEGRYKLPPGFRKNLELFNLHRVAHVRHLVLVEGYFGTIRLHGEHVPAAGLMGSSISDEQVALLKERCPNLKAVTVLLDGGEAARKAADAVAARLARRWWVRLADLPDGAQPDTVPGAELARLLGRGQQQGA
jgi:DNA primase